MPVDAEESTLDAESFANSCGETIDQVLNLDTWERDPDIASLCQRIEDEVGHAVETENRLSVEARTSIFQSLSDLTRPNAPPSAGVYKASVEDLQRVIRQALFNGGVEVCDGTRKDFETLPITITQIGICLATYQGNQQSFSHRLYQRDLRISSGDVLDDLLLMLDSRRISSRGIGQTGRPSILFRRGLMEYAERAALTYKSSSPWRMGHGQPATFSLLTGSGSMDLLRQSLTTLRDLILEHRKFVFVPSEDGDKRLLTLGYALREREYAIVHTAQSDMEEIVFGGKYNPADSGLARSFCREVGSKVAVGIYRTVEGAPPYVFYSHVDYCHEAALIVMADSLLQEYRGFPLLIDLADRLCRAAFGNDIFDGAVQNAYSRAGSPYRFLGERQTRG
jgi:hypothetical protein